MLETNSALTRIGRSTARGAILTGNPDRVPTIAGLLGKTTQSGSARGFAWHLLGELEQPLLVCSTGIGSPAAAIVVEELSDAGIEAIVRIGTCGAVAPHLTPGDLVVSTGCVRHEGTTAQYIETAFPAVPNHLMLSALVTQASTRTQPIHFGITHCKDSYYSERPERNVDSERLAGQWRVLRNAGVLATEMEASALFIVGHLRAVPCAAILMPATDDTDPEEERRALTAAVSLAGVALSAVLDAPAQSDTGTIREPGATATDPR